MKEGTGFSARFRGNLAKDRERRPLLDPRSSFQKIYDELNAVFVQPRPKNRNRMSAAIAALAAPGPSIEEKQQAVNVRLDRIAQLSEFEIQRIVTMKVEFVNNRGIDIAYHVFNQLDLRHHPKIQRVVARIGINWLSRGKFEFGGNNHEINDNLLFCGIDELLKGYPKLWAWGRWRFNRPSNPVVNKALERISDALSVANNAADRKPHWKRLNKFTPEVIKRCLVRVANGRWELANMIGSQDIPLSELASYPNILLAFAQIRTQQFDAAIKKKNMRAFFGVINHGVDAQSLQHVIRRLVALIGTSRMQGKYEDMLEAALESLMQYSDPKNGLALDRDVLRNCVGIISRYYRRKNRVAFFNKRYPNSDKGYTLRAYIRQAFPDLGGFETLREFATDISCENFIQASSPERERLFREGECTPTQILYKCITENLLEGHEALIRELFVKYGAQLHRPLSGSRSCFRRILQRLNGDSKEYVWLDICIEFYRHHNTHVERLLRDIVAFINHSDLTDGPVFEGAKYAIAELRRRGVPVTPEVEAANAQMKNQDVAVEVTLLLRNSQRPAEGNVGSNNNNENYNVQLLKTISDNGFNEKAARELIQKGADIHWKPNANADSFFDKTLRRVALNQNTEADPSWLVCITRYGEDADLLFNDVIRAINRDYASDKDPHFVGCATVILNLINNKLVNVKSHEELKSTLRQDVYERFRRVFNAMDRANVEARTQATTSRKPEATVHELLLATLSDNHFKAEVAAVLLQRGANIHWKSNADADSFFDKVVRRVGLSRTGNDPAWDFCVKNYAQGRAVLLLDALFHALNHRDYRSDNDPHLNGCLFLLSMMIDKKQVNFTHADVLKKVSPVVAARIIRISEAAGQRAQAQGEARAAVDAQPQKSQREMAIIARVCDELAYDPCDTLFELKPNFEGRDGEKDCNTLARFLASDEGKALWKEVIEIGAEETLRFFLIYGKADPNQIIDDTNGMSSLHWAIGCQQWDSVQALVALGANINARLGALENVFAYALKKQTSGEFISAVFSALKIILKYSIPTDVNSIVVLLGKMVWDLPSDLLSRLLFCGLEPQTQRVLIKGAIESQSYDVARRLIVAQGIFDLNFVEVARKANCLNPFGDMLVQCLGEMLVKEYAPQYLDALIAMLKAAEKKIPEYLWDSLLKSERDLNMGSLQWLASSGCQLTPPQVVPIVQPVAPAENLARFQASLDARKAIERRNSASDVRKPAETRHVRSLSK